MRRTSQGLLTSQVGGDRAVACRTSGWLKPFVRGRPLLDRGIRESSASLRERRLPERGVGHRRRRETRAGELPGRIPSALSQPVRLPVHVQRHLPVEDGEQFVRWVRVKGMFVARRSVYLGDGEGTARRSTVRHDTDDCLEKQEMFTRFFVEAVSFSSSPDIYLTGRDYCVMIVNTLQLCTR
jgi:hypothetical protein